MIVKTEPSIPRIEQKLSGDNLSKQSYNEALELMEEEGYYPKSVILKRKVIPPFGIGIPLKLVADFDPQVEDADMIFILRENNGN